jgi:amidase
VADIHDLTVTELAAAIRAGELSPVEITDHYLDRIDQLNEQVGAFYTVTHELARAQAADAEKAAASSRQDGSNGMTLPPLTGIPVPIKDLNMVAGVRMTLGSTIYADNVAPEDDYLVGALRSTGIVITGKTATPEFGLPCYTETRIGPPARTPWDLTRSGRAAAPVPRWPLASRPRPRAATAAGPSGFRRACAACSGSSRVAAGSPGARSCRT